MENFRRFLVLVVVGVLAVSFLGCGPKYSKPVVVKDATVDTGEVEFKKPPTIFIVINNTSEMMKGAIDGGEFFIISSQEIRRFEIHERGEIIVSVFFPESDREGINETFYVSPGKKIFLDITRDGVLRNRDRNVISHNSDHYPPAPPREVRWRKESVGDKMMGAHNSHLNRFLEQRGRNRYGE